LLAEILEEDKRVYRLTRADVLTFKRALQELPSNRTKRFPGLTALQVIRENKARATPFPTLDTKTINNKYLSDLPDSPAASIKVDVVDAGQPRRVNFGPSDLVKIFSAERFDTRKALNERQWAELISLFGGMRASDWPKSSSIVSGMNAAFLFFAIEEKTKNVGSLRISRKKPVGLSPWNPSIVHLTGLGPH